MIYLQQKTCVQQHCSYFDLGTYLILDKNYEKAIDFFRLALEMENPPPIKKMQILLHLYTSFKMTFMFIQMSKTLDEIIQLLPEVTKLPPHELYHIRDDLNAILSLLRNTASEETNMLIECVVKIIMMAADDDMLKNLNYPTLIVSTLYKNGNYTKAAQLGTHVLQSFIQKPNFEHDQFSLKLLATTGMAKFYSGNYSQGCDAMEQVMEMIIESPEFLYNELFSEYWKFCIYLIPRAKYAPMCFGSPILGLVKGSILGLVNNIVHLTFVLPLDVFPSTDNHENIYVHHDVTEIKYSSSREVATKNDSPLIKISKYNVILLLERLLDGIKTITLSVFTALTYVLSFPSVRLCINVASILIRLDLLIVVLWYFTLLVLFTIALIIILVIIITNKVLCGYVFTCFWPCFEKLYCFLLFSRRLHYILVVFWKCCELLSQLLELINDIYENNFMYIIVFIKEKSLVYDRSCCSILTFYSTLYFLFSVMIVQICLWLYMLLYFT